MHQLATPIEDEEQAEVELDRWIAEIVACYPNQKNEWSYVPPAENAVEEVTSDQSVVTSASSQPSTFSSQPQSNGRPITQQITSNRSAKSTIPPGMTMDEIKR